MLFLVSDAGRRGYRLLIEEFWDQCDRLGLPLDRDRPITASAFCQARKKLKPQLLRHLMRLLANEFEDRHGTDFRRKGHRVFAVDGNKVCLQRSDELFEAVGSHGAGYCPQMLRSTLYNALSGVVHDVTVAPTRSSERDELLLMLDGLSPGDILTLDRGYPSYAIVSELKRRRIHFLIRIPARSTFGGIEPFLAQGNRDGWLRLNPSSRLRPSQEPVDVRVVAVHRPDAEPVVFITDLVADEFSSDEISDLYHQRWTVEELYKLETGEYLGQGQFHAKSLDGVKQEVYTLGLFINMARAFTASAAESSGQPYEHICQKHAMLALAANLVTLLVEERTEELMRLGRRMNKLLPRVLVKPRPGRHYPRRSYKPPPKWTPLGHRRRKPEQP